jgi:hypothetical protein
MLHFISDSKAVFHLDNQYSVVSTLNRLDFNFKLYIPAYRDQYRGANEGHIHFNNKLTAGDIKFLENEKAYNK